MDIVDDLKHFYGSKLINYPLPKEFKMNMNEIIKKNRENERAKTINEILLYLNKLGKKGKLVPISEVVDILDLHYSKDIEKGVRK